MAQDPGSRSAIAKANGVHVVCEVIKSQPPSKVGSTPPPLFSTVPRSMREGNQAPRRMQCLLRLTLHSHGCWPRQVVLASLRVLASLSRVEEIANNFKKEHIEEVVDCIGGSPDLEKNVWGCQVLCNLVVIPALRKIASQAGATEKLCDLIGALAYRSCQCWSSCASALGCCPHLPYFILPACLPPFDVPSHF